MKNYVKNNLEIIAFSFFVVLFIYAIRIFNYNIGVDTEKYLFDAKYFNMSWNPAEGRFGYMILQWLFEGIHLRINLFSSNFLACSFLFGSCLLWLSLFRHYSDYKNLFAELAFCLFYLSSKVWVEIIYFTMMATEVMFAVLLSPICVFVIMEGIIEKNKFILSAAIIFSVLVIAVYQPIIVLIFAGLLAVYILRNEKDLTGKRDFGTIIIVTVVSVAIYFILNFILLRFVFKSELSGYVTGQLGGGYSFKNAILMNGVYIYSLFFANNVLLNLIVDPMIEFLSNNSFVSSFAGNGLSLVEHFHSRGLHGCSLFFPAVVLFLIFIFKNINIKNRKLFRLAGVWFVCCAIAMAVACGGVPAERYVHSLPLVTAFLFFYTLCKINKKSYKYIWFTMILIFGYYQAQNSSLLNVSDQKRYTMDVELARIVDDGIKNTLGYSEKDRELVVFGDYKFKYGKNYLRGEVIGRSAMLWGGYMKPERPATFMNCHGYNYLPLSHIDETKINELTDYAKKMPAYPDNGWVSKYKEIILVKLGE